MLIWRETLRFKSPVEHVYKCINDFHFNEKFFKNTLDNEVKNDLRRLKYRYNRNLNELTVIDKEPIFKIAPDQDIKDVDNEYSAGIFIPLVEPFTYFGNATIECWFYDKNGCTVAKFEIHSNKTPNPFWWVFIKIIVMVLKLKNKADTKKYVEYVEKTA